MKVVKVFDEEFAEKLKRLRKAQGMTLQQLSAAHILYFTLGAQREAVSVVFDFGGAVARAQSRFNDVSRRIN